MADYLIIFGKKRFCSNKRTSIIFLIALIIHCDTFHQTEEPNTVYTHLSGL